jgi:hypothetical protein
MKKIFILLILHLNLTAQNCEYVEYYQLIEIANKDFLAKDFKNCEKNLKLAFSKVNFPLGQDLNLALNVAQLRNNAQWAEEISIQLAKGGVPLRYFEKLNSYKWYPNFKNNFETYSEYYSKNFNSELRDELILLIEKDKKLNEKHHSFRTGDIEMTLQELIDGSYEILNQFLKLLEKNGFPYEKNTGYKYHFKRNSVETFWISTMIIHILQRGVRLFDHQTIDEISCKSGYHIKSVKYYKETNGFGDSTGIEQEMLIRYNKFKKK